MLPANILQKKKVIDPHAIWIVNLGREGHDDAMNFHLPG